MKYAAGWLTFTNLLNADAGQFVCSQFPYQGNDTIFWIFPIVPCHAFCMWHWPIGKDLDLSFIWGHHHLYRGLYRVIAPLSFQRSISLASLFTSLSIFGWSDLLQILRKQAAFSFTVLCIIMFYFSSVLISGLIITRLHFVCDWFALGILASTKWFSSRVFAVLAISRDARSAAETKYSREIAPATQVILTGMKMVS